MYPQKSKERVAHRTELVTIDIVLKLKLRIQKHHRTNLLLPVISGAYSKPLFLHYNVTLIMFTDFLFPIRYLFLSV